MLKNWGLFLTAIIGAIILAVLGAVPPSPKSADAPADQFSSARAMADIRIIAAKPHPTGSAENEQVRTYLARRMGELGMRVFEDRAMLPERGLARLNRWSGAGKTEQEIVNVIGILPGKDRAKPALMLMAHHDTVWGSPGAADDTIGIASIFEIIRALKEGGTPSRDVIAVLTDAEELGLVGARHFFANNPLADRVGAVINFEARGGGGTSNMFQTSAENGAAARLYARSVSQPSTSSLSTFVYSILPNDTDLTPALQRDYTAFNIANLGRAKYYHSPKIDADALSEATVQQMGMQGLELSRALLSGDEFPKRKPDAVFFDVFGFFTLVFSPFWGWIMLGLAAIFYALSVRGSVKRAEFISGAARMLAFIFIGGLFLFALNWLSGNGKGADYYDRLAAIPELEFLALIGCISALLVIFGRGKFSANEWFGAAIPIFLIGVAGQALAPTAVYFIVIPVFLCGLSTLALARMPARAAQFFAAAMAIPVIGYMIYLGHLLMLGVGPNLLAVATLPAAIATLPALALFPGFSKGAANKSALAGLAICIILALWIRLDPVASTVPVY